MNESQLTGERIRRFASAADDSDWAEVMRRAGMDARVDSAGTGKRTAPRLSVRRRWLAPAFALVVVLGSGATYAAVRGLPWWQTGSPPIDPQAVVSVARDNLPADVRTAHARTVAQTGDAALVAVPLDQTGYCLIPALDGHASLGAQCEFQVASPERGDDDLLRSFAHPAGRPGGPAWIVYGRITDPRAAAVELNGAGGASLTVALHPGGFFLATIPGGLWGQLANSTGVGRILDASRAVLRSGCVSWGPSPTSAGAGSSDTAVWRNGHGNCTAPPPAAPPALASADLSRARKLVELTLVSSFGLFKQGTTIALWEAPGAKGAACIFQAKADETPTPFPGSGDNPVGGGACYPSGSPPATTDRPIHLSIGATRLPNGDYSTLIDGSVDPAAGITRLELHSATAVTPVAFANSWFLAELPDSTSAHLPDGGPWLLIGYDSGGNEVSRVDLDRLQADATPH